MDNYWPAKMIFAWFLGTPFTVYAHLRASLQAVSQPSTPMGATKELGVGIQLIDVSVPSPE